MAAVLTKVTTFIINNATELVIGCAIVLAFSALVLLIILIRRKPESIVARLQENFSELQARQDRLEPVIKDEIARNREETARSAQQARQELSTSLKSSSDSLQQRLAENIHLQKDQLDSFSKQLMAMTRLNEQKIEAMRKTMETQLQAMQAERDHLSKAMRQQLAQSMRKPIMSTQDDDSDEDQDELKESLEAKTTEIEEI